MRHLGGSNALASHLRSPRYVLLVLGGPMALGPAKGARGRPKRGRHHSRPAFDGVLSTSWKYKRGLQVFRPGAGEEDGGSVRERVRSHIRCDHLDV